MTTIIKKLPYYKEPADIFGAFYEEEHAVFLDSSLENEMGRFSIIGIHPYCVLEEKDGRCFQNGILKGKAIETILKEIVEENYEENETELPLTAGAIGYFSYDYGRKFEKIPSRHEKRVRMPDVLFVFYDNLMIADLKKKELYLTAREKQMPAKVAFAEIETRIKSCVHKEVPPKQETCSSFHANFKKQEYKDAIDRMISYIEEGDIYIANMTQQLQIESRKTPYEMFHYLRSYNPAPFGAYLNYGDFQVVSASMERFLQVHGNVVETRPIKGTRKRGSCREEDERMRLELQQSEKDRSELLMIVDLERNDLSRVCKPGSVQVMEHFAVEAYATVFHLVTTIRGELREDVRAADLIPEAFPGGSITGAPKIRAMEIIDELEADARGLYTGSIGYFSFAGDCDFNIVIRTAVYQDGVYHLGVGGGITCESDLEFEYEETLQKAKALLEAAYEEEKA